MEKSRDFCPKDHRGHRFSDWTGWGYKHPRCDFCHYEDTTRDLTLGKTNEDSSTTGSSKSKSEPTEKGKIVRNMSTEKSRKFWAAVKEAAASAPRLKFEEKVKRP